MIQNTILKIKKTKNKTQKRPPKVPKNKKTYHSGQEGCSGDKKLIIDMSYIFEKVMKNAIQIH